MGWSSYLSSVVCACASVRAVFVSVCEHAGVRVNGALCARVIRLRVSSNQNDETLSRNSLRYLSKANSLIAVNSSLQGTFNMLHNLGNSRCGHARVNPCTREQESVNMGMGVHMRV